MSLNKFVGLSDLAQSFVVVGLSDKSQVSIVVGPSDHALLSRLVGLSDHALLSRLVGPSDNAQSFVVVGQMFHRVFSFMGECMKFGGLEFGATTERPDRRQRAVQCSNFLE